MKKRNNNNELFTFDKIGKYFNEANFSDILVKVYIYNTDILFPDDAKYDHIKYRKDFSSDSEFLAYYNPTSTGGYTVDVIESLLNKRAFKGIPRYAKNSEHGLIRFLIEILKPLILNEIKKSRKVAGWPASRSSHYLNRSYSRYFRVNKNETSIKCVTRTEALVRFYAHAVFNLISKKGVTNLDEVSYIIKKFYCDKIILFFFVCVLGHEFPSLSKDDLYKVWDSLYNRSILKADYLKSPEPNTEYFYMKFVIEKMFSVFISMILYSKEQNLRIVHNEPDIVAKLFATKEFITNISQIKVNILNVVESPELNKFVPSNLVNLFNQIIPNSQNNSEVKMLYSNLILCLLFSVYQAAPASRKKLPISKLIIFNNYLMFSGILLKCDLDKFFSILDLYNIPYTYIKSVKSFAGYDLSHHKNLIWNSFENKTVTNLSFHMSPSKTYDEIFNEIFSLLSCVIKNHNYMDADFQQKYNILISHLNNYTDNLVKNYPFGFSFGYYTHLDFLLARLLIITLFNTLPFHDFIFLINKSLLPNELAKGIIKNIRIDSTDADIRKVFNEMHSLIDRNFEFDNIGNSGPIMKFSSNYSNFHKNLSEDKLVEMGCKNLLTNAFLCDLIDYYLLIDSFNLNR